VLHTAGPCFSRLVSISHARPGRALALLAAVALTAAPAQAQTVKRLAQGIRGSVVLLTVLDPGGEEVSSGTGFAIAPNLLATNHHVIADARRIRATFADSRSVDVVAVVADDERNDLALLRLPPSASLPPLALSKATVEPGDRVVVVGNPLGLAGTISEGIVGAVRSKGLGEDDPEHADTPLLQITAPISPGSSGSPVVDERGEVVGVAVAYYEGGQNVNFAVPVELLRALQARGESGPPRRLESAPDRWVIVRNVGISLLFFAVILVAFRRMRAAEVRASGSGTPPLPRVHLPARRPPGWGK
jgi:S1-C subfamily serine protease